MGNAVVTSSPRSGQLNMQGIVVPQAAVDAVEFFRRTKRQRTQVRTNQTWLGNGNREVITIPQVGILSTIVLTVKGTATVSNAAVTPSYRWPYDLVRNLVFSANGQSALINVSGAKLRARELMQPGRTDRGLSQSIGGSTRTQGTMSMATESWGMSPGTSAGVASYPFELSYEIPVAYDPRILSGAIFAQTSSTNLQLEIEWNSIANLISTGSAANLAFSGVTFTVETEIYPIPYDNGVAILPDLSLFHFLTQSTDTSLAIGENQSKLVGVGVGKQLMRVYGQIWNNGVNATPLALNTTNIPSIGYRFGGAEQPEKFAGGSLLGQEMERNYDSAMGLYFGFWSLDWATANAFRDSIDEGLATELRVFYEIGSGVTVSAGNTAVEIVREELLGAPGGV